jgi:diguanylate cyclase (GGDEF)-like protein
MVGGLVYFVSNVAITGVGLALAQDEPVVSYLARDLAFQAATDGVLLALSPVVVVVSSRSLWLVPLLVVPLTAVYRSARFSLENVQLVEKLEDSVAGLTELNRRNEHMALHDGLTGLPNRILFRDRLHQAVLHAKREGTTVGVMLIDLDRFKEINDTLGHHNGDILLQQVGPRLRKVLRESDSVARLGGDEFAILLPEVSGREETRRIAERVRRALEQPFAVGELTLDVEASVGIAMFPEHGRDVDVLLQRADLAMYVAKSNREGSRMYAERDDQYDPARLALLGELRRAIDERQLTLHFQPKADLRDHQVHSVEALMRWVHPQRGLVPPREFIPFAEHTTLIRPLTHYALNAAMAQGKAWRDMGIDLSVAVNLSVRNLLDTGLPEEVARLLRRWELPAEALELEITESVLMSEPARALRVLAELHGMGVGLSLDDFGTGYSSLAYLRQLPVDEIKIDRSFVTNMLREDSDATIVRSTIDLARNLGLRVVAEGVEDAETWERLASLDCDVAQGFYLSPPVGPTELTRWWFERSNQSASNERRVEGLAVPASAG